MGGHYGGGRASEIAEREIKKQFFATDFTTLSDSMVLKEIYAMIQHTQSMLIADGQEHQLYADMGTTVVLAILINTEKVFIYHAGDSRAYLIDRANYFRQVTIDHNFKNYVHHRITSQSASIIHALGPNKFSREDDIQNSGQLFKVDNQHSFIIFLTTDGTFQVMSDMDFYQRLTKNTSLQSIAAQIVDDAILKGSSDNCSVAILKYDTN